MLIVYGSDLSTYANKVRFVANALGLDYEYKKVNMREKEHLSEEFLKIHPAGKIPAIDDDGFCLFESDAIIKYLCDKEGSELYPRDVKKRATVDQWINFVSIHVGGAVGRVVFNRVFAKYARIPVDERSLTDGLRFLNRFLPVLEKQLDKNMFLASDQLSLADLNLLATIDSFEVGGIDLTKYKKITTWRNKLKKESFYTKCHKEYGEILKQKTGS